MLPAILNLNKKNILCLAVNLLIILLFAIIYWIWGNKTHFKYDSNEKNLSFLSAFYHSIITHSTIGYGDITPISPMMRFITIIHSGIMISYLFLISL